MITVEHLTKCYGDFLAVDDLSFEIDEGHVYGFLGPNGAGKSTTMNIMTGCLSATGGHVKVDGYDVFETPKEAKRRIGYLPEQPPLYLSETPEEYLRFVGQAKGLKGQELEEQIAGVMEQTRIREVRRRPISALSWTYDGQSLAFHKDEVWYYDEDETFPVNEDAISALLEGFQSFGVSFIIEEVEDYGQYGLDDPERTITLDYTTQDEDGNETAHTVSLAVSRAPAERWDDTQAGDGTETDGEEEVTAYARVDDSPIIYKITTQEYRALMDASYDTLRHKEILPADLENVSQVDVNLDGTSYTVTASGEGEERTWSYGEQELETSDLPDALQALTADSFTGEEPTGQEEISLTLHLSLEGEPTVSIQFCRYDGTYCLAVVDGQPTALVTRSQVVDLQEAVYAVVLGES